MSWLLNLGKAIVSSPVGKALDAATVAFTHPIQSLQTAFSPDKTFKQLETEHFAQPLSKQITETVLSTAGYAAAIVLPATAAGRAAVVATGKALIPTTAKGIITTAIIVPVAIGAISANPLGAAKTVLSAPSKLVNVGQNVAAAAANPNLSTISTIYKENPLIAGGATAAIVGGLALAAGNVISNITNTAAVKANTAATIESATGAVQTATGQPINIINQIPASPQIPAVVAPEKVAPAGKTPKKKAKKKAKPKKKAKKKTRRSKKKKKKSIKRRKS